MPFTVNTAKSVFEPKATLKVTKCSNTDSPSAATTLTTRSLSPARSSSLPTISTAASESVASATTSTAVVPASSSTTSPETTSVPFTWKTARDVSLSTRTLRVTSNSSIVSRSAAVTVIIRVFSPATRSLSPVISKKASGSVVSTTTSTSVVCAAISTVVFGSTSSPLI